ncbi:MAG: agmatine deiminase family protein, partial [Limisphaerales bacterium]
GREDYEALFQRYLGINHTIWLKEGIVGDDTHGHVDDITRFVGPERIVTVVEPRRSDDNHQRLVANLKTLKASVLENGRPPEIIELPMPGPVVFDGLRLPASYANFIILNQSVLVPTFNDPNDAEALQVLKACFPSRQIIGIHSVDLIWGLGSLHCLSQQIPA